MLRATLAQRADYQADALAMISAITRPLVEVSGRMSATFSCTCCRQMCSAPTLKTHYLIYMTKLLISILVIASLQLTACSRGLFSVHRIDIQQGNLLEADAVNQIKPGMTPAQVESILGAPVLEPVLDNNRWDYIYYVKKPDRKPEKELVSIFFEQEKVSRIEK
ncbi:MAG: outer membrane protein assembly factor BamE [Thiotrichales bacterium]